MFPVFFRNDEKKKTTYAYSIVLNLDSKQKKRSSNE